MTSFKNNFNKSDRTPKPSRRPKPDKRWTLLFIGNHGRTITLKRFKGIVLIAFLILSVTVAAVAGLFLWNQNIIREKRQLETQIDGLKEELTALRHDKDILMTRVVLAESKVREKNGDDGSEQQTEEETDIQDKEGTGKKEQTPASAAEAEETPEQNTAEAKGDTDTKPSDSGMSVAIEDFKITGSSGGRRLKVQFKIKNTSKKPQHVSGHAIVVLKGAQVDKNSWMSIPGMPLVDGKPTGRHRGYTFGINYFRTMRFSSAAPRDPEKYETASVYVFTSSGELLLEQDFAVTLPAT
jgi:hypothetical protein